MRSFRVSGGYSSWFIGCSALIDYVLGGPGDISYAEDRLVYADRRWEFVSYEALSGLFEVIRII